MADPEAGSSRTAAGSTNGVTLLTHEGGDLVGSRGALLDSAAGEQAARMTAMDNATRNAGEMIDDLSLLRLKLLI